MYFALNNTALLTARHELGGAIAQGNLTPKILSNVMSSAFHGTDASGAWDWRTAYDVMQAAALDVAQLKVGVGHAFAKQGLEVLSEIASRLPTETRRSERQMQLQQFSTALEWGWVAACAAQVSPSDIVLEPSAGTGCLARLAQMSAQADKARSSGIQLVLNELDPVRCALLDAGQHLCLISSAI